MRKNKLNNINLSAALTNFFDKYDVYVGNDYNSFTTRIAPPKASGYSYNGGIIFSKDSNGEYIAEAVGQTVLQTVDVSSLINDYGADSQIRGIAVIGNSAYRTVKVLSELTALEKYGDTLTEYGAKDCGRRI